MTKRILLPDDFYNLQAVGGAQVSPDGTQIIYTLTRLDKEKDKGFTDLYLYDIASGKRRRLTYSGQESSPRFSPDGKRIAFISARKEKGQIYVLNLDGGEAWSVPTPEGVSGPLLWFPDGSRLAYTAKVYSHPESWTPYPGAPEYDTQRLLDIAKRAHSEKKPDADKASNEVKVITRFKYRADGVGYLGDLRRQVFICEIPQEAPLKELEPLSQQLTCGDYDHESMSLSPDGRFMVVEAKRQENADQDLRGEMWLLDLATKEMSLLFVGQGRVSSPQWSPCGRYIAFNGHDNSHGLSSTTDLYLLSLGDDLASCPKPLPESSALNITRPLDRGVGYSAFWAGSDYYFTVADRGTSTICKTSATGEVTTILKDYDLSIAAIHGNGNVLVYNASQPDVPEELYVLVQGSKQLVSHANTELAESISFGAWEKICYHSDDHELIEGWVVYPVDFEPAKKYPLVLFVHGGPHGWYGPQFLPQVQQFAGEGYVVLLTNPRGSESYGQDFAAVIDRNWGDRDYVDVMSGVDYVISRGFVDEENLFLYGWSYGGYLTCWIITQTNRFKAACAGASVTNMQSGYGTSDITLADEWEYGGQSWKDGAHLLKHSPLSYAANVITPVLLMHGELDLRCPIGQSEEFYIALKRMNKQAVMIRYPSEYHGPRRPLHRVDLSQRLISWFNYFKNQKG